MKLDYSLYLVTDNTNAILGDRDLVSVVKAAIDGGVTAVQLRDKDSDTNDIIQLGKSLHEITCRAGIPLIINDRVDIALAIGAEGVHIGQDDMELLHARTILGNEKIIGVTAASVEEALAAAARGADYLGIGTVYATATKGDTKSIIGPSGVREILRSLVANGYDIPSVCIGGINDANLQRVLFQTEVPSKKLDGAAVVSAIIGAPDPGEAASRLRNLFHQPPPFLKDQTSQVSSQLPDLINEIPGILERVATRKPINHNMTNLVVQNFAANIAIAVGSSPIMSSSGTEAQDLAALGGALVVNMGTVTPHALDDFITAIRAYNSAGNPIVFDPVGGGATQLRRNAINTLLTEGYFSLIKGNESEIQAVLGDTEVKQHGVDSGGSVLSPAAKATLVEALASRERNVVLMTGQVDYLSDGARTFAIHNGHEYLGSITGSGCALGTTIAACLAVERGDPLLAALSGLLLYEIAAERAAAREGVHGPGTFIPVLIDALYQLRESGDKTWLSSARINAVSGENRSSP